MVTAEAVRTWCLSQPGVQEKPHFDKSAFRTKRAIFCTMPADGQTCVLKLSAVDQSVFAELGADVCYPVPGAWGRQGYTIFVLDRVEPEVLWDALATALNGVR